METQEVSEFPRLTEQWRCWDVVDLEVTNFPLPTQCAARISTSMLPRLLLLWRLEYHLEISSRVKQFYKRKKTFQNNQRLLSTWMYKIMGIFLSFSSFHFSTQLWYDMKETWTLNILRLFSPHICILYMCVCVILFPFPLPTSPVSSPFPLKFIAPLSLIIIVAYT